MSNDRKLRFGVIGAGAFADACHVPDLLSHPQAEVMAICARLEARPIDPPTAKTVTLDNRQSSQTAAPIGPLFNSC
jgi:predicted dehydrogenase